MAGGRMLRKSGGPWAQVVGGGWPWRVTRGVPDPVLLDVCRAWVGYCDKLMSSKTSASKPSPVLEVWTVSPWVQVSQGLLASTRNQWPGAVG